jgi:transposase
MCMCSPSSDCADGSLGPDTNQRTSINPILWFEDRDGFRVIFCRHEILYRVACDDTRFLKLIAVSLRQSELATQLEIAAAFGHSVASQRRWEGRFTQHGIEGLDSKPHSGRPPTIPVTQHAFVQRWFHDGVATAAMARRLGVSKTTVRRLLRQLGLVRPPRPEPVLPFASTSPETAPDEPVPGSSSGIPRPRDAGTELMPRPLTPDDTRLVSTAPASQEPLTAAAGSTDRAGAVAVPGTPETDRVPPPAETSPPTVPETPAALGADNHVPDPPPAAVAPVGFTVDTNPFDRSGDRWLASQGLLADAAPLFGAAEDLPRAGVLLALPALAEHGGPAVVQRVYGWLGRPAFYGLRTVVLTVVLLALLRVKRPENLKEYAPRPLGRLLGLDRAPEVKTLRRKLTILAARPLAGPLLNALAKERIAQQQERVAFLYVDGHVRAYSGQEVLGKTKKPQRQVATPATTDTWVHDAQGEPLLVVTSEMNAGLTSVLEPILDEVQRLLPTGQRLTVIFDRGGWSPKLFERLIARGVDVITYRKGKKRPLPPERFREVRVVIEGREKVYSLCDQPRVRVGRLRPKRKRRCQRPAYLWLRQVTVLRKDGRQTTTVTNRQDLAAVEVVVRLFGRWCQENYFKYAGAEYALDALVEYGAEAVAAPDRPNPERRKLVRRRCQVQKELQQARAALGAATVVALASPAPSNGLTELPTSQEDVCVRIAVLEKRQARLTAKIKQQPKRVPARGVKKLKTEKKRLVDALKMMAYQVETSMLREVDKHHRRSADEGRTLLQAIYQSSASVEVKDQELWITIAQQSSPHRTEVLRKLCVEYDSRSVCYPGTNLRLRYAVASGEPLSP